jgi:hypothetical protein
MSQILPPRSTGWIFLFISLAEYVKQYLSTRGQGRRQGDRQHFPEVCLNKERIGFSQDCLALHLSVGEPLGGRPLQPRLLDLAVLLLYKTAVEPSLLKIKEAISRKF